MKEEEKKEVDEVEMEEEEEEVETVEIRDISWCPPHLCDWLKRLSVNSLSSTQRCHSAGAWLGSRGGAISQGAGPGREEQAQQQQQQLQSQAGSSGNLAAL